MVLLDWAPPDHLGIGRKRGNSCRRKHPAAILALGWSYAPTVAAQTRIVSAAGIRLDHRKSVRPFKGRFCNNISEFESSHPSHAVRSPPIIPRPCRRTRAGAYEIDILAHEVRALADAGQRRREHLLALRLEQAGHSPPGPAAMAGAVNEHKSLARSAPSPACRRASPCRAPRRHP